MNGKLSPSSEYGRFVIAENQIRNEFARAQRLHPIWPADIIHQAAVVAEEAGEVVKAANDYRYHGGSLEDVRTELVQTGAMVLRMLINLPRK